MHSQRNDDDDDEWPTIEQLQSSLYYPRLVNSQGSNPRLYPNTSNYAWSEGCRSREEE